MGQAGYQVSSKRQIPVELKESYLVKLGKLGKIEIWTIWPECQVLQEGDVKKLGNSHHMTSFIQWNTVAATSSYEIGLSAAGTGGLSEVRNYKQILKYTERFTWKTVKITQK